MSRLLWKLCILRKLNLVECNKISSAYYGYWDDIDKRNFQMIFKRYVQAINTMKKSGLSQNDIKKHLIRAKRHMISEPENAFISIAAITFVLENIDMYLGHKI